MNALLDRECAGDTSLRAEVETLIRGHEDAGSFLDTPSAAPLTGGLAGQTVGPYQIRTLIGAGGMGEVYKGWDARLKRDVAIKVLPEVFSRRLSSREESNRSSTRSLSSSTFSMN